MKITRLFNCTIKLFLFFLGFIHKMWHWIFPISNVKPCIDSNSQALKLSHPLWTKLYYVKCEHRNFKSGKFLNDVTNFSIDPLPFFLWNFLCDIIKLHSSLHRVSERTPTKLQIAISPFCNVNLNFFDFIHIIFFCFTKMFFCSCLKADEVKIHGLLTF